MSAGVIKPPGRQPTRSEQLLLQPLVRCKYPGETIVIHHITEDTPHRLQLEIERRFPVVGRTICRFERIWI